VSLDDDSFAGCSALEEVSFRDVSKLTLKSGVFRSCRSLKTVALPTSMTDGAFLTLNRTFYHCSSLENINMEVVDLINGHPAAGAFEGCTSLRAIDLSALPTYVHGGKPIDRKRILGNWAFFGCTRLSMVKLPPEMEEIGSAAFQNCRDLTTLSIPDSVESIGSSAFQNSSLSTFNVSTNVDWRKVLPNTFSECPCPFEYYRTGAIVCDCVPGPCRDEVAQQPNSTLEQVGLAPHQTA
jgi:hypothetical protein